MATSKRMDFSRFPRKHVPKHEVLFFEEDASREMYLLLTGALGVFRDEIQVATIDQPLSIVGEISALTGRPRNATVRALEPSTVVSVEDPDALFAEYPQLCARLARILAERLAAMNSKFVDLKGVVAKNLGPSAADKTPAQLQRMEAETLPPGLLMAKDVHGKATQAARAAVKPTRPAPAKREGLDEMMGALSDLLDFDPSLGEIT